MGVFNNFGEDGEPSQARGPMGFTGPRGEKGEAGVPGMTQEEIKDDIESYMSNMHYVNPFASFLGVDGVNHIHLTSSNSPVVFTHYQRGKNATNNKMYRLETPYTTTGVTHYFTYSIKLDLPKDLPIGDYSFFFDFYLSSKPDSYSFSFVNNNNTKAKGSPKVVDNKKIFNVRFDLEKTTMNENPSLDFRIVVSYVNKLPSLTSKNMLRSWLSFFGTIGIPPLPPVGVYNNFFSVTREGTSFSQNTIDMGGRKILSVGKGTEKEDAANLENIEDKEASILTTINNKETSILSIVNDKEKNVLAKISEETISRRDEVAELRSSNAKEVDKSIVVRLLARLRDISNRWVQHSPIGDKVVLKMSSPGYESNISGGRGGTILTKFDDDIDTITLTTLADHRSPFHLLDVMENKEGSPSTGIMFEYSNDKDYSFTIEYEGLERADQASAPSVPSFTGDEVRIILYTIHPKRVLLTKKFTPLPGDRTKTFDIRRSDHAAEGRDWIEVSVEAFFKRATSFKLILEKK